VQKPLILNVGYGNYVMADRIVAIASPDSAPIKRIISNLREQDKVIDATCGRKTRAVIITDAGYLILSAVNSETAAARINDGKIVKDQDSEKEDF